MINDIIYSFIIGDSFGLSILNNNDECYLKLRKNNILNIEKGFYSFFTTNMIATIDSIISNKKIDYLDIMNRLTLSLIVGKYTNNGNVIRPDLESVNILEHYRKKNNLDYNYDKLSDNSNPLSRVIPIVIYNYYNNDTLDTLIPVLKLTTNNESVLLGCFIYYKYLLNILDGYDKYKSLKIYVPKYFDKTLVKKYKNVLKGNINYKDITFDDNIENVLNIVFYVVLNSDNMNDVLLMTSNLSGNTNIYCSLIFAIASQLYGVSELDILKKDIKNKVEINKIVKYFEKLFNY